MAIRQTRTPQNLFTLVGSGLSLDAMWLYVVTGVIRINSIFPRQSPLNGNDFHHAKKMNVSYSPS